MKLYRARSPIHGIGLFAGENIQVNDNVLLAFTQINHDNCVVFFNAGYINHSIEPNTKLMRIGRDYYLYATRPIHRGTEITCNYFDTPHCINKPEAEWAFSR